MIHLGIFLKFSGSKKKYKICSAGDEEETEEVDELALNCFPDGSTLQDNILYYIGGFVVKKMFSKASCCSCRESFLWQQDKHNYASAGKYANFTNLKNNGGLVRPSKDVLIIIKSAEKILGAVTHQYEHLHVINVKIIGTVLHKTKYTLAKSNSLSLCDITEDLMFQ